MTMVDLLSIFKTESEVGPMQSRYQLDPEIEYAYSGNARGRDIKQSGKNKSKYNAS